MSQSAIKPSDLFRKNGIGESVKADIYFILIVTAGVLSGAILLLTSETPLLLTSGTPSTFLILAVVAFIFAIPSAYFTRRWYIDRMCKFVTEIIGTNFDKLSGGINVETALCYLGHNVSGAVGRGEIVVDDVMRVFCEFRPNYDVIRYACKITSEDDRIESMAIVLFGKTTNGAKMLIAQNNIKVFSMHDVYDAVYEKIKSDKHIFNC